MTLNGRSGASAARCATTAGRERRTTSIADHATPRSRELVAEATPDIGEREASAAWDLATVLFASGTTGAPTGVLILWGQLTATSLANAGTLGPVDAYYSPFPRFSHERAWTSDAHGLCGGLSGVARGFQRFVLLVGRQAVPDHGGRIVRGGRALSPGGAAGAMTTPPIRSHRPSWCPSYPNPTISHEDSSSATTRQSITQVR